MRPEERSARARLAAAKRHHPDDDKTHELVAQFKTDRLAQHIQRVVDSAPPLSADQRARLSALLATGTHVPGVPVAKPLGGARPTGTASGVGGSA